MKLKAYAYVGDDAESEITFANTAGQAKAAFADIMGERFIDVKLIPEGHFAKSAQGRMVSSTTNLDKIRTMSPEELGTFLSNLATIEDCFECPIRDVCNERMVNPNNEAFHTCELSFYHWLQREYKPGYFENQ